MIGKLFRLIFFFLFLTIICSAAITAGLYFLYPTAELPFEQYVKENVTDRFFPPDTVIIPDTMLTDEERLSNDLDRRRLAVMTEEQMIKAERDSLNAVKLNVDQQKANLETLLADKKQVEEEAINNMAKLIDPMKADKAAAIIADLPDRTIIQILLQVKPRQAAKITEALPVDRGAEILSRMSKGTK